MKQNKSNGGAIIIAIIITAVVIGSGVYWLQRPALVSLEYVDAVQAGGTTELVESYESVKFRYAFRYPQEWYIRKWATGEDQPEIICVTQEIIVSGNSKCLVSVSINTSALDANIRDNLTSREEVIFANYPATKIEFTTDVGPPLVSILVSHDEYIYVISYDPEDLKQEVVSNIVESFTFTL